MNDDEIAAALFSGQYDELTVGEFAARFPRDDAPVGPTGWHLVNVPVVNGVATLPDGRTVRSSAQRVQVAIAEDS